MEKKYATLQKIIEKLVGRVINTPRDFDYLSMYIFETMHIQISATTLKRFWGYLPQKKHFVPRISTLNILAQLVGYKDWQDYLDRSEQGKWGESGFTHQNILYTRTLNRGTCIRLVWAPDRMVQIRLEGQDLFTITEVQNSKLSVGDTFICPCFVQNEPLFLHCLVHNGGTPTNYVCGKTGGIRYDVFFKPETPSKIDTGISE